MSAENDLKPLIVRALGAAAAERALGFELEDRTILESTAEQLQRMMPPTAGASVLMSAAWALHLRDKYNLPAVAVAGDLRVAGRWLFRATDAIPDFRGEGLESTLSWRGHCWVEVGGLVCDASIFGTVYGLATDDVSRQFFEGHFGIGRRALVINAGEMPEGLKYRRRAVLSERQMVGFFESLRFMLEGEKPVQASFPG